VKNQNTVDAPRFVWPFLAKRRAHHKVAMSGMTGSKRKTANRAWVFGALCILGLAATLLIPRVGKTTAVVAVIMAFGILALTLYRATIPQQTRRQARVLRDVRPLLQKPVIVVPEMKRAPRIVRAEPALIIPALPPDRPRTRISERRPCPVQDDDD
jgi:hypothetical protein